MASAAIFSPGGYFWHLRQIKSLDGHFLWDALQQSAKVQNSPTKGSFKTGGFETIDSEKVYKYIK